MKTCKKFDEIVALADNVWFLDETIDVEYSYICFNKETKRIEGMGLTKEGAMCDLDEEDDCSEYSVLNIYTGEKFNFKKEIIFTLDKK